MTDEQNYLNIYNYGLEWGPLYFELETNNTDGLLNMEIVKDFIDEPSGSGYT